MSSAVAVSAVVSSLQSNNTAIINDTNQIQQNNEFIGEKLQISPNSDLLHLKLTNNSYNNNNNNISHKVNGIGNGDSHHSHDSHSSDYGQVMCNGYSTLNNDNDVTDTWSAQNSSKTTQLSSNHDTNNYEDNSGPPTLCSSPLSSPDETEKRFDEALLEERFYKLGFTTLVRPDSPVIQINDRFEDDDDDDNDNICRAPLIRSTSLKTGKTPPGTPRKKFVRFADSLGLDLESVRHIMTDELPVVPQSAFNRLQQKQQPMPTPWFMQPHNKSTQLNKTNLILEFIQPGSLLSFLDRVRTNRVCLENCIVSNSAGNLSVTCIIRVLNVSFEKSVTVRYTPNEWLNWNQALASYIPNSCDGWSDKFTATFSLSGGYYLSPGQRLLFAVRYSTNAEEYWDNNMGLNYSMTYRF